MLLHNKVLSVVGLLSDETDPMVSVMKVRHDKSSIVAHPVLAMCTFSCCHGCLRIQQLFESSGHRLSRRTARTLET